MACLQPSLFDIEPKTLFIEPVIYGTKLPAQIANYTSTPIIISLFDYSGTWSEFYRKAGYRVIQIDIKLGFDILTWNYKAVKKELVYGILAAPPCTDYSVSGAQYWPIKDKDGRTAFSNLLVEKTLEIVEYFNPAGFWVMENPVGRLKRMLCGILKAGEPSIKVPDSLLDAVKHTRLDFNPCDFSDPWTKKTLLWGSFNDLKKSPVEPIRYSAQGSWTQLLGGDNERTKELRSITPIGFAKAFYEANTIMKVI